MRERALVLGAVAARPSSVLLWESLRAWFRERDAPMEFSLVSTADRLGELLLAGAVDLAWLSPVAYLRLGRRLGGAPTGVLLRDTDVDVVSGLVAGERSEVGSPNDLAGRQLAVGGRDNPFARLVPVQGLRLAGLDPGSLRLVTLDADGGRHGESGRDDAAILGAVRSGRVAAGAMRIDAFRAADATGLRWMWTAPPCNGAVFAALPSVPTGLRASFVAAMTALRMDDERGKAILDLAGATAFVEPRTDGWHVLRRALDDQAGW